MTRKLCVGDTSIVMVWTEVKWICCLLTYTTIRGLTSSSYMLPIFTKPTCTYKYITYSSTCTYVMYRCIYARTLHVILFYNLQYISFIPILIFLHIWIYIMPGVDTYAVFWSSVFRLSSSHYFFPLHLITFTLLLYVC